MEIEQAKKILKAAAAAVNQLGKSQARRGPTTSLGVASPGSAGPPPSHGQQATTSTSDNVAGTEYMYTLDSQPAEAEATFEQYVSKESTPAKRKFRV